MQLGLLHVCFVKDCLCQIDLSHLCILKKSSVKIRTFQIHSVQLRMIQANFGKMCAAQMRILQAATVQIQILVRHLEIPFIAPPAGDGDGFLFLRLKKLSYLSIRGLISFRSNAPRFIHKKKSA